MSTSKITASKKDLLRYIGKLEFSNKVLSAKLRHVSKVFRHTAQGEGELCATCEMRKDEEIHHQDSGEVPDPAGD